MEYERQITITFDADEFESLLHILKLIMDRDDIREEIDEADSDIAEAILALE